MQLASHLRLSRCGIYQFRLVLPNAVAALLGQRSLIKSLGTKRPEQARLVAYRLSAKMLPLLRLLRRQMAFDPNSIDPKDVRELILGHLKITHPDGTVVDFGRVETSNDPVLAAQELRQIEKIVSPAKSFAILSAEDAEKMLAEHEDFSAIVDAALAVKAEPKPKVSVPDLACTIEAAIEAYMSWR